MLDQQHYLWRPTTLENEQRLIRELDKPFWDTYNRTCSRLSDIIESSSQESYMKLVNKLMLLVFYHYQLAHLLQSGIQIQWYLHQILFHWTSVVVPNLPCNFEVVLHIQQLKMSPSTFIVKFHSGVVNREIFYAILIFW